MRGDASDGHVVVDAGTAEASTFSDGAATDAAREEVPLGDVCGDAAGLESSAPWPMRGGCPKRAGVGTAGPRSATIKWSLSLSSGESSPAVGADGTIWLGTRDFDVLAVSGAGLIREAFRTGGPVLSSPARSASGVTIASGTDGVLYGITHGFASGDAGLDASDEAGDAGGDPAAGVSGASLVFRLVIGVTSSSPVIGADGTIYVGTAAGKLVAIASDGSRVLWTKDTFDTSGSSPAIASDGTIYVGSSNGSLYALSKDGNVLWSFSAGAALLSPTIGGDDTVYVGAVDGKLHAVSPDGKLRWSYAAGAAIGGPACVRAGLVYVGSNDKKLHAVDTASGQKRWAFETLGEVGIPVVDASGTVFVGSTDGRVYAITPSGLLLFAVNVRGRVRTAPAFDSNGVLYVATETALVAIGP